MKILKYTQFKFLGTNKRIKYQPQQSTIGFSIFAKIGSLLTKSFVKI